MPPADSSQVGPRQESHAFGLDVSAGFTAPGLPVRLGAGNRRRVTVDVAVCEPAGWDRGRLRLVGQIPPPPEPPVCRVDEHPVLGWRLSAPDRGRFYVSRDGSRIACLPAPVAETTWHRFLLAQVLPLASVLQGLELLHASAVVLEDRAFAFTGPSGAGKTSVALQLFLRGAGWLADDVLALEVTEPGVLAHAGPALVCIRHDEHQRLGREQLARLGPQLATNPKEVMHVVRPHPEPVSLAAVYFLERSDGHELRIEPVHDVRSMLGSIFMPVIGTAQRLTTAFEVATRLIGERRLARVHVPRHLDAAGLAAALVPTMRESVRNAR